MRCSKCGIANSIKDMGCPGENSILMAEHKIIGIFKPTVIILNVNNLLSNPDLIQILGTGEVMQHYNFTHPTICLVECHALSYIAKRDIFFRKLTGKNIGRLMLFYMSMKNFMI